MAETYSIASLAAHGGILPAAVKLLKLPDSASQLGHHLGAMATGKTLQCKGPDGALALYRIDNERSLPGALVLIPLFP